MDRPCNWRILIIFLALCLQCTAMRRRILPPTPGAWDELTKQHPWMTEADSFLEPYTWDGYEADEATYREHKTDPAPTEEERAQFISDLQAKTLEQLQDLQQKATQLPDFPSAEEFARNLEEADDDTDIIIMKDEWNDFVASFGEDIKTNPVENLVHAVFLLGTFGGEVERLFTDIAGAERGDNIWKVLLESFQKGLKSLVIQSPGRVIDRNDNDPSLLLKLEVLDKDGKRIIFGDANKEKRFIDPEGLRLPQNRDKTIDTVLKYLFGYRLIEGGMEVALDDRKFLEFWDTMLDFVQFMTEFVDLLFKQKFITWNTEHKGEPMLSMFDFFANNNARESGKWKRVTLGYPEYYKNKYGGVFQPIGLGNPWWEEWENKNTITDDMYLALEVGLTALARGVGPYILELLADISLKAEEFGKNSRMAVKNWAMLQEKDRAEYKNNPQATPPSDTNDNGVISSDKLKLHPEFYVDGYTTESHGSNRWDDEKEIKRYTWRTDPKYQSDRQRLPGPQTKIDRDNEIPRRRIPVHVVDPNAGYKYSFDLDLDKPEESKDEAPQIQPQPRNRAQRRLEEKKNKKKGNKE